jgi:spermidine synthase
MRRLSFGVLLIALSTLVLELMLTRAFDVTLTPNLSYFVVSLAVFSFGLAGIYATLRPIPVESDIRGRLVGCCVGFAATVLLLHPIINALPLDYTHIAKAPVTTVASFVALYLALLVPFFLAGYVLIAIFSKYAAKIQRLYFWDLVGAGLGTVLVIPFILQIGPGGLIVCAAALGLVAAALFSESPPASRAYAVAALVLALVPAVRGQNYIDFTYHLDKRGILKAIDQGRDELVRWDPISKIDVLDETFSPETATPWHKSGDRKAIEYDGGNQTSYFYKFDGNLKALRELMDRDRSKVNEHFWQIGVLASHYLKRDSGQSVLVIGSAGGQETKASLIYGAQYVDTAELVPTVVDLATGLYSPYIGDIFHNPAVHPHATEGRSFLRSTDRKYDIIQIYSNHTSSSIAQGSGAMSPVYLQTEEAYEEYFSHLTPTGILHINHYGFPRMISTAALAWKKMGRTDFRKHVALFFSPSELTLPTLLIKMSPWTAEEIAALSAYLAPPQLDPKDRLVLMENPLDPSKSFLSDDFYSGNFPSELAERIPVDFTPRTDDEPYFSEFRKHIRPIQEDPKNFVDPGTAYMLNSSLLHGIPMDQIHLWITAAASAIFALLFILVPLRFSKVGREEGATALPLLAYFACLGAGFITIELVFIQKFMQLIGSPLYTYSTVIFTMLLGAGIGSAASERLGINTRRLWTVPFVAIIAVGLAVVWLYPTLAKLGLALPIGGRIAISAAMIFPLGFFLGMPFPLGILAIERQPRGAIAWAWGMNGLFTVIGGLASVLASLELGFNLTLLIALALYGCALGVFKKMRDMAPQGAGTVVVPRAPEAEDLTVMRPSYDGTWQPGATARSTRSQA